LNEEQISVILKQVETGRIEIDVYRENGQYPAKAPFTSDASVILSSLACHLGWESKENIITRRGPAVHLFLTWERM
jgi:hypothetical protein